MGKSDSEWADLPKGQQIRVIPLDTNTFLRGLQEVFPQIVPRPAGATEATRELPYLIGTNGASGRNSLLTKCFASLGIKLTNNGGGVVFDQRTSAILVRAAAQDLDAVERVLELVNKAPPQVQIDAKFVTLTQQGADAMMYLGSFNPSPYGAHTGPPPGFQGPTNFANPSGIFPGASPAGSNPGQIGPAASNGSRTGSALLTVTPNAPMFRPPTPGTLTGILTDPQFRVAIQAIEQRDGSDILSMPRITTLSGRQARVSVTDLVDIINGVRNTAVRFGSNAPAPGDTTNTPEEGPVLDVIPTVNADGFTIHLVLNATLRQFLGYDMPAQIASQSNAVSSLQTGVPTNAPPPVPRYRNVSRAATAIVWDGQTVVLGVPMPELDPGQPQSTNTQSANLLIFITATIVDPAGNRVHTDDEMPFAKVSVPPQEAIPPQPQSTNVPK